MPSVVVTPGQLFAAGHETTDVPLGTGSQTGSAGCASPAMSCST